MSDEQALAHQIIKQALRDPANVMMLGEVKPLADAYVALETRAHKLENALRSFAKAIFDGGAPDNALRIAVEQTLAVLADPEKTPRDVE